MAKLRIVKIRSCREIDMPAGPYGLRGKGRKLPEVTGVRPETERTSPGQDEARITPCGGPKRFYVQVFL